MIIITVAITQIIRTIILNHEQQGTVMVHLGGQNGWRSEKLRCEQTSGAGRKDASLQDHTLALWMLPHSKANLGPLSVRTICLLTVRESPMGSGCHLAARNCDGWISMLAGL